SHPGTVVSMFPGRKFSRKDRGSLESTTVQTHFPARNKLVRGTRPSGQFIPTNESVVGYYSQYGSAAIRKIFGIEASCSTRSFSDHIPSTRDDGYPGTSAIRNGSGSGSLSPLGSTRNR